MIQRLGGNFCVCKKPIQFLGAGAVQPKFDGTSAHRGNDAGLEITLQIKHHIKRTRLELLAQIPKSAPARLAIKDQNFIDIFVAIHKRGAGCLQNPSDARVRAMSLDGRDHGQCVHDVADGAHHDHANSWTLRQIHALNSNAEMKVANAAGDMAKSPLRTRLRNERARRA